MFSIFLISLVLLRPNAPRSTVSDKSQEIQTKLDSRITDHTLEADGFVRAIIGLASKFDLHIGVEWVRSPETLKKVSLSWKNAAVRQMLDAVVKSQPGYQLEINDGVAHIFPTSINSNGQDFLNLKIERFEVRNQVVEIESHKLHDLVRLKVSPPHSSSQRPAGIGYSQGANVGHPEFSLSLKVVIVRPSLHSLPLAPSST